MTYQSIVSFAAQRPLNSMDFVLVDHWSYFLHFQSPAQEVLTWATSWSGPTTLSSVPGLTLRFLTHLELVCVKGEKKKTKFHSSTHRYPVFPTPLFEDGVFSTLFFFFLTALSSGYRSGLIAGSCFFPYSLIICMCWWHAVLIIRHLWRNWKSGLVVNLAFLFFRVVLTFWGLLWFCINFKDLLWVSMDIALEFWLVWHQIWGLPLAGKLYPLSTCQSMSMGGISAFWYLHSLFSVS